jgi:hypothetical protein
LAGMKTRCKQCVYVSKEVKQEPCNECSEIHYKTLNFENHFLATDKNLINDLKKEG